MTASTTPRLGLILPSSSDNFVIDDFDDTFTRLDNAPGITPVANYTALTALSSTLTSAQDSSVFLQSDNGSLWQWVKPGSAAGSFRKITSKGLISIINQSGTFSTATTSGPAGPAVINTTFTFPGGRWVGLLWQTANISNSGTYGYSLALIYVNGQYAQQVLSSGGSPNRRYSQVLWALIGPGAFGTSPGSTVTVTVRVVATTYGGGTTSITDSNLSIIEL